MRTTLSSALCATAILLSGVSTVALAPAAQAQVRVGIGFNFFHDRLAASGRWIHHPVWGDVWRPRAKLVGADFQPYTNGHWEYTDEYGWYWVSDDAFDDVVYHYGRWVYDPQDRWLWVPGYTWAPAWVAWREGDDYTGWMPLPPDESFMSGAGLSFGVDLGPIGINFYRNFYGSRVNADDFFVFVGNRHLVDRDYRRFVVPRAQRTVIINRTRTVTKFEVVNNRVVNRGIDVKIVERATGRRIAPVSAKMVIKPNAVITTVDEGRQVRQRERAQHPVNVDAFRKARANGAAGNEAGGNANAGGRPGENAGGGKPNGNGPAGAENNPAAGNTGAAAGAATGGNETTGKRKRHQGDETASPSGATGAGQGDENTTSPTGESPKQKRSRSETGAASDTAGEAGAGSASGADTQTTTGRHRKSGAAAGASGSDTGNSGATDNPGAGSSDETGGGRKRNRANDSATSPSGNSGAMTGPATATPDQSGTRSGGRMRNPGGETSTATTPDQSNMRSGGRMRNPGGETGSTASAPGTNGSSDESQPKKKKKHPDNNSQPSGTPD